MSCAASATAAAAMPIPVSNLPMSTPQTLRTAATPTNTITTLAALLIQMMSSPDRPDGRLCSKSANRSQDDRKESKDAARINNVGPGNHVRNQTVQNLSKPIHLDIGLAFQVIFRALFVAARFGAALVLVGAALRRAALVRGFGDVFFADVLALFPEDVTSFANAAVAGSNNRGVRTSIGFLTRLVIPERMSAISSRTKRSSL